MFKLALSCVLLLACTGAALEFGFARRDSASAQDAPRPRKEHGKLYKEFEHGPKLADLTAQGAGDVTVVEDSPIPVGPGYTPPPFLNAIACEADAVVVGVLGGASASDLTDDGHFIFTDYELTVEEVVKDNAAAPLRQGGGIVVTRPGGEVRLNGRSVRALDDAFKPFAAGGRYVLFLRYVPATGAYRAFGSGSFRLDGDRVVKLGDAASQWGRVEDEKAPFMADVHAAAVGPCTPGAKVLRR